MSRPHVTNAFYLSLLEFLLSAKQNMVAIGAEFGLTSIQAITLLLLDEQRQRSMKSFGQLYHCDASNVTGIVDGLEQRSLVERRNDPNDRRIKVICITPAGKRLQQQIIERLDANRGFLFDALTDEEATQFVHIVSKLAQSAGDSRNC
jgi:DNA-binding MarR family transcriptional regulator